MTIQKWKKIKTRRVYDGYRKIDRITFKLPDKKLGDFDIVAIARPVVCILGITKDKKIILTKQYRPGPQKIFYELPGGGVEKRETPFRAAKREFLEETGYTGKFEQICITSNNAYSTLVRYCYVATDCKKVTDELKLDDSEFIEVYLFTLKKFRKLLKSGRLTDVETGYLGLDYLNLL